MPTKETLFDKFSKNWQIVRPFFPNIDSNVKGFYDAVICPLCMTVLAREALYQSDHKKQLTKSGVLNQEQVDSIKDEAKKIQDFAAKYPRPLQATIINVAVDSQGNPYTIKCKNPECGRHFYYTPPPTINPVFESLKVTGSIATNIISTPPTIEARLECPYCHTLNPLPQLPKRSV